MIYYKEKNFHNASKTSRKMYEFQCKMMLLQRQKKKHYTLKMEIQGWISWHWNPLMGVMFHCKAKIWISKLTPDLQTESILRYTGAVSVCGNGSINSKPSHSHHIPPSTGHQCCILIGWATTRLYVIAH